MKKLKLNVRKKILIINAVMLVLLSGITVFSAWFASSSVIKSNVEQNLVEVVSDSASDLLQKNGVVDDSFIFSQNSVFLSIYSSDGTFINGVQPASSVVTLPIKKGILQNYTVDGVKYYVYDFEVVLAGRNSVFVRGITKTETETVNTIVFLMAGIAIAFTAFAIIASLFIIKKAVKPLEKITKSISSINESKDLSLRLEQANSGDEDVDKLQNAYNSMLERLEELFKNQERFTSDVSHELRTPLTVILSESEYALQEAKTEADKDASLGVIYRQTKKLTDITNQLLEFSRFVNKAKVELEPTDISEITENEMGISSNAKNIKVKFNVEKAVYALVDRTLYVRLLQNLIDNAIKYGKEKGEVVVTLCLKNSKAVLSVRDNGIGMSEDTAKHVYDRFFQADNARSSANGLGLGLSFVKEIVRLFGAEVTFNSKLNEGTEFIVVFKEIQS